MKLAGITFERGMQSLVHGDNGKSYDHVMMKVLAFSESDFAYLKNDWESHHGYINDEEGRQKHIQIAETKRIRYEIEGWFDITGFYGMH